MPVKLKQPAFSTYPSLPGLVLCVVLLQYLFAPAYAWADPSFSTSPASQPASRPSASGTKLSDTLTLTIAPLGRISITGKTVTMAQVARAVQRTAKNAPSCSIVIIADPKTEQTDKQRLLDLLKSLRISDQAISIIVRSTSSALEHDPTAFSLWLKQKLLPAETFRSPGIDWPGVFHRLADDLRIRSLNLQNRTVGAIQYISRLIHDLQHISSQPTKTSEH